MKDLLDKVYEAMDGNQQADDYSHRHGVKAAAILTVYTDESAGLLAEHLRPRIEGKTVVEIGGGIGLLAFHLGTVAKRVYCIEANPMWSWVFACTLLKNKPKNVSYLFGSADEFTGQISGEVALFCSHSDIAGMRQVANRFAPVVIDVYSEIIEANPEAFDWLARRLRPTA